MLFLAPCPACLSAPCTSSDPGAPLSNLISHSCIGNFCTCRHITASLRTAPCLIRTKRDRLRILNHTTFWVLFYRDIQFNTSATAVRGSLGIPATCILRSSTSTKTTSHFEFFRYPFGHGHFSKCTQTNIKDKTDTRGSL